MGKTTVERLDNDDGEKNRGETRVLPAPIKATHRRRAKDEKQEETEGKKKASFCSISQTSGAILLPVPSTGWRLNVA